MKKYYSFILVLIFLINVPEALGQPKAFESISVGIFTGNSIAGDDLLNSWNPEPSLQLLLRTPFYAGDLETGVRYTRFNNTSDFPDYSDFDSFFFYMGWGYDFAITDRFSICPGLRFGTTFFQYDEAKIYTHPNVGWQYDFDTNESEFAYELLFRSTFRLSKQLSAHAGISYNRTLTFHPISLNCITAGFTYTFTSPRWLKKVLK